MDGDFKRRQTRRSYADMVTSTSRRAQQQSSYTKHEEATAPEKKMYRTLRSNRKNIFLLIVAFLLVVGGLNFLAQQRKGQSPRELAGINAMYTIYFPRDLPEGYDIEKSNISYSNDVLTYQLSSTRGTITISQQPVPQQPLSTTLPKTKELQVEAGKVSISRFSAEKFVVTISNEESLITLNGSLKIDDKHLVQLLELLQPV